MMHSRSIRFRLSVWYAVALAVGLAIFAVLTWFAMQRAVFHEIDEALSAESASFETFLRDEVEEGSRHLKTELREFSAGLPPGSTLSLTADDGFTFSYPQTVRHPHERRTLERSIDIEGHSYHFTLTASTHAAGHMLRLLAILLVSLIPVVTLVASLGGAWLSRRALEPVAAMTREARSIGIDRLSQRLPVPATGDELQELAESWNTMLARLESAVATLSQFAADASHELRTPLAVIHTSAELALRRGRSALEYQESLEEIMDEARRVTALVEDLLYLARNDASSVEIPLEPLDLASPLAAAIGEAKPLADRRQIRLRESGEGSSIVSGNRAALRRLFLVILDNAVKYSPPGSEVRIHVTGHEVSIADSGPGIAPEDLPHIFQRFYRADKVRNSESGGYGLGLSLADSIARRHGAKIEVRSELGRGSEFRVVFPAEEAAWNDATSVPSLASN